MDKYSNSIIEGASEYLSGLRYNADNDQYLLDSLYSLQILNFMIEWSYIYDLPEDINEMMMSMMDFVISHNKKIPMPHTGVLTGSAYNVNFTKNPYSNNKVYSNVNNFYDFRYWDKVYDSPNAITLEKI